MSNPETTDLEIAEEQLAEWQNACRILEQIKLTNEAEIERLRELLRGFRQHYGEPEWHDKVVAEIGPA